MSAEEDESCSWYELTCHAGEFAGNVADTVLADFIESIHSAAIHVMDLVGTWWMNVDGPDFESDAVSGLQDNLSYFVWVFGVIGFMVALGKLAITQDPRSSAMSIGGQIFRMILAGGVYMTAIPLLLDAGDATSVWLLEQSHGDNAEAGFSGLLGSSAALMSLSGAAFLVYVLLFLGSIVNFIFMLFRNVMFLVLIVFIVVLAASSSSEAGQQAWRKANGWLLALLLFKPVAAAIYALGFRLMNDSATTEGFDEIMNGLVSSLTGLLILVLAALALPALIKFVVPAAATGAGAFSGGAALGATAGVAAGAAVLGTTGGAGAAASTAGGAGAGATTGGAGAAASTAGGGGADAAATTAGGSGTSSVPSSGSDNGSNPPSVNSGGDSGSSNSSGSGSDDTTGGDSVPVITSAPPAADTANNSDSSPAGGQGPTDSGSSSEPAPESPGGSQANWSGAYQAYEAASGAMTPRNTDGEDET